MKSIYKKIQPNVNLQCIYESGKISSDTFLFKTSVVIRNSFFDLLFGNNLISKVQDILLDNELENIDTINSELIDAIENYIVFDL